jgi:hypothetical protein
MRMVAHRVLHALANGDEKGFFYNLNVEVNRPHRLGRRPAGWGPR